jgi:hypothetical protein
MQAVTTIGLDIAKSVFQVHGIDAEGNHPRSRPGGGFLFWATPPPPRRCDPLIPESVGVVTENGERRRALACLTA